MGAHEGGAEGKRVSTLPPRAKLVRPKGQGTVSFDGEKWVAKLPRPSRLTVAREDTEARAEASLRAYIAPVRGAHEDARAITFGDWMTGSVFPAREAMRLRSVQTDRERSRVHIEQDRIGKLPLALANTTAEVRTWLQRMLCKMGRRQGARRRLSARTVRNALTLLRRGLQYGVEMGLLDHNAARDIEVPRSAFATDRSDFEGVLEPEEQRPLLLVTQAIDAFTVMLRTAMGLGLRRAELMGLQWSDVHLLAPEPYVTVRKGKRGGPTKGGKPRKIPLFGIALCALSAWRLLTMRARRHVEQLELYGEPLPRPARVPTFEAFGEAQTEEEPGPIAKPPVEDARSAVEPEAVLDDPATLFARRSDVSHDTNPSPPPMRVADHADVHGDDLVFPGRRGGQRVKAPLPEFRESLRKAGVRRVRWHDLRHTCATSLLMGWWGRKWSPAEVQKMLGHSSVQVTERYLHARNELIFQAAREMRNGDVRETGTNGSSGRLTDTTDSARQKPGRGPSWG